MNTLSNSLHITARALLLALLAATTWSPVSSVADAGPTQLPRQVYWGDTHLHSALSTDAFGFGARLGPEQAYRFASGEPVTSSGGLPARLDRPLDFVVLADHAESLGMMPKLYAGDARLLADATARRWHEQMTGSAEQRAAFRKLFSDRETRKAAFNKLQQLATDEVQASIWGETIAIADRFNRPGVFTTLLGFEWSSTPGGSNLHRVVIFRDGSERAGQVLPMSMYDSDNPEQLWAYLQSYEQRTGGRVMAIPHNGNLSNGLMFPAETRYGGGPIDKRYAALRARWEPVVEVTQIKGDGETHPLLSPDDEFADYETWDKGNLQGVPKSADMLPREYARAALKTGLALETRLGINPYRFGLIGSTDSHTTLATADEGNFLGKHSSLEPTPDRWKKSVGAPGKHAVLGWQQVASGYAGVWAQNNTREAIWDALQRREVYATTGPRITVRLFGGWQYSDADAEHSDLAAIGYAGGVPMGGVLPARGAAPAPRFLVAASRDPIGARLDRIQVVKGWLDADGSVQEQVFDVAWSGERQPDRRGRLPAVGNSVDLAKAQWRNNIGAAELATVWQDPDFDPARPAFYYVRVLEIPTPRWTAYDATRFGVKMAESVPMVTQERVYTSPIWYTP